ncbi:MAG: thioredoxin family protein [Saprospiraceae bacterium]
MNRTLLFLILIIASFIVFPSCNSSKRTSNKVGKVKKSKSKTGGVQFVESKTLTAVLEQAERENKLVFVDFYTTWCTPCKMMDQDVFPDRNIGTFFKKNFLSYKVNAEKGNGVNLAVVYNVSAYPTLLFLNEKGRVLESKQGAAYQTELMAMANRALANRGN